MLNNSNIGPIRNLNDWDREAQKMIANKDFHVTFMLDKLIELKRGDGNDDGRELELLRRMMNQ